ALPMPMLSQCAKPFAGTSAGMTWGDRGAGPAAGGVASNPSCRLPGQGDRVAAQHGPAAGSGALWFALAMAGRALAAPADPGRAAGWERRVQLLGLAS